METLIRLPVVETYYFSQVHESDCSEFLSEYIEENCLNPTEF